MEKRHVKGGTHRSTGDKKTRESKTTSCDKTTSTTHVRNLLWVYLL